MDKYDVLCASELENVDVIALFEQSPQIGKNLLMAIYIPTARELFEGTAIERDVKVGDYCIELIPTTKLLYKIKRMEFFFINALSNYIVWFDDTFDEIYDMIMDDLVWSKEGKELLCKSLYFSSRSIAIELAGRARVGQYSPDILNDALCMFDMAINGDIYTDSYDDCNENMDKIQYLIHLNKLIKRMDSDKLFDKFLDISRNVSLTDINAYHEIECRLINYTVNRAKRERFEESDDDRIDGIGQCTDNQTIVILDDYPFINKYINSGFETDE